MVLTPWHQQFVSTGLELNIPIEMVGKIHSPWQRSRQEPIVALGLVTPGHKEIDDLIANLGACLFQWTEDRLLLLST